MKAGNVWMFFVVERGLADSREKARALILAGQVPLSTDRRPTKPAQLSTPMPKSNCSSSRATSAAAD